MPNSNIPAYSYQKQLSPVHKDSCNKVIKVEKRERTKEEIEANVMSLHYKMVRFQNQYAPSKTMRLCQRVPIQHKDGLKDVVITQEGSKTPRFGNLMSCFSHNCPNCSRHHKKPMRKKARLGLTNALKAGYSLKMVTFTIPREYGNQDFKDKFDAMNKTFTQVISRLRTKCKRDGVELYTLRGLDVTIDSNRYDPLHLHIHALIVTNKNIDSYEDWIWRTYRRLQNKKGIRVSKKGFDISNIFKDAEITDYIVKSLGTIEQEITNGNNKRGRTDKTKGFFEWFKSIVHNPTRADIYIYQEYLRTSKGRRVFGFSHNWDDLLALEQPELPLLEATMLEETRPKEKFYIWRLDAQLWEAVKALKVEMEVLGIIKDRFKSKQDHYRYKQLELLIDQDTYELFGEYKKNYYCKSLLDVLNKNSNTKKRYEYESS